MFGNLWALRGLRVFGRGFQTMTQANICWKVICVSRSCPTSVGLINPLRCDCYAHMKLNSPLIHIDLATISRLPIGEVVAVSKQVSCMRQ